MAHFSESLKILRQQANLSMQALADKAKVSKSMISKIERDEVQPTLDVAARLAKAFGKSLSEMLHAPQGSNVVFLPHEQQALWEDAQQIKRRNISPIFEGLKLEWLHVEMPAGANIKKCMPVNALGIEKYILVIKGELTAKLIQQTFHLKKGDSLFFDAASEHEFSNQTKQPVEYYILIKYA